jgi:hypothetical protein
MRTIGAQWTAATATLRRRYEAQPWPAIAAKAALFQHHFTAQRASRRQNQIDKAAQSVTIMIAHLAHIPLLLR